MLNNPNGIRALADAMKALIRFTPPRSFIQWMEQEIILPEGDQKGQRFDWGRRPWQRLIADAIRPGGWNRVIIAAGSQTGKTFLATAYGVYCVDELGDSVQIAAPSETTCTSVIKGKLEPMIVANPRLAARLFPNKYKVTNKKPDFRIRCPNGGMFAFPFSGDSMVSYPARVTIGTEHAQMPSLADSSDMTDQLRARADGYKGGWRGIFESTPRNAESRHARDMAAGTCSIIVCPCPHCGEMFEAGSLDTLKGWDVDTPEDAVTNIFMACPKCDKRIGEQHRLDMQAAATLKHKHAGRDILSVTVNWFHSIKTFAQCGEALWYAKAEASDRHPTYVRKLYNDFLAEPTDLRIEAAGDMALPMLHKENIVALQDQSYRFNENAWPETAIVVGAIDVGKYDLWWLTAAYLLHNNDLAVLNYGRFIMTRRAYDSDAGKYFTPLPSAARLLESLDNVHARMVAAVSPVQTAIDVNYEYYAEQKTGANPDRDCVANWANSTSGIIGVRGVKTPTRNYGKPPIIPSPACEYMQQTESSGRQLLNVYVNEVKTRLARAVLRTTPGNQIHLPANALTANSIAITRHLTSEYPTEMPDGKLLWKADGVNHLWDCLTYAYAMGILQASIYAHDHRDEYDKLINRSESALKKARQRLTEKRKAEQPPPMKVKAPIRNARHRRRLPKSATGR